MESNSSTTKMAGHLKEVINNKFYFVLDEVGASDCESELGSENSAKGLESAHANVKLLEENNLNSKITPTDNSEDKNMENNDITTQNFLTNDREQLNSIRCNEYEEQKSKSENSKGVPQPTSASPNKTPEVINVVDMDIDSGEESVQDTTSQVEPLIRITFRDHYAEKLLKSSLIRFFYQKFEDCFTRDRGKLELEIYEKDAVKLIKNNLVSFDLDTTPTHGNYSEIPHYGKNHDFILSDKNINESKPANLAAPVKRTCFNCLKNHNLKDCPEVKDFRVINKNRLKFQSQAKSGKISRYHLDVEQRFSKLQPGVFSKKLRNALNLKNDQLPKFIYRMRLLGYPPGWLEEAKVSHSGVAMYDSKGHLVLEEDEEEGEIIAEGSKDKFDITKIIEFPGFNVPVPSNFKDEGLFHGCPEISEEQSKESLINALKPKTVQAYVKKSLSITKGDQQEIESKRIPSPTIEEMEEKKRQLLMELDDEESGSVSKLNSEDSSSGTGTETETSQTGSKTSREPGTVRNSAFGTPILKSFSPFSKLPSREQFSVNVSDVINFENLPNSTGKYESMRHVITKIRTSASKKQLNNC